MLEGNTEKLNFNIQLLRMIDWAIIWQSRWGRVVNGLPQGTPFTTLSPRLFHKMSFIGPPGLVKRDFFHCRHTQPVPRKYHTQCYIVEVQTLVELKSQYTSLVFPKNGYSLAKVLDAADSVHKK